MAYFRYMILNLILLINLVHSELNFSEKDLKFLREFRSRVRDVLNPGDEFKNSNDYLITWIRDQNYDLAKAEEKFRKSIQWRQELKVDSFIDDKKFLQSQALRFPFTNLGNDRTGCPTFGLSIGKWPIRKFVLGGEPELFTKQVVTIYESGIRGINEARNNGRPNVTQWNFLTNLAGYNVREHGCLGCIPILLEVVNVYENNYPLTVKNSVMFNSPKVFERLLQLMRPLMSPATRNLVKVFPADKAEWQNFLNSFIDLENLSYEYGGLSNKHI